MLTINSSVNFVVYCYMSTTFRRIFYEYVNKFLGASVMPEVRHSEASLDQNQVAQQQATVGTGLINPLNERVCQLEAGEEVAGLQGQLLPGDSKLDNGDASDRNVLCRGQESSGEDKDCESGHEMTALKGNNNCKSPVPDYNSIPRP